MKNNRMAIFKVTAVLLGLVWINAYAEENQQAYKPCNLDDLVQGILPTYVEVERKTQGSFSKSYILGTPFDVTPGSVVVKLEEVAWVPLESMALTSEGFISQRHQFRKGALYSPVNTISWRGERYEVLWFGERGAYGVLIKDDGTICERTIERSPAGYFMGSSRLYTLEPQGKLTRRPTGKSIAILYKGIDSGLLKFEMRSTNPSGEVVTLWEKSFDATSQQINLANFTVKIDKIAGMKLTIQIIDENLKFLRL